MPDQLQLWLHGRHVADIVRRRRGDVGLKLRYTPLALESWPLNTPVVSCSLPLGPRPLDALPYLRGLLPEGAALDAMAGRARTSVTDTFGLLRRFGRDVAGAAVIGDGPPDERRYAIEPYDDETLADEVAALADNPLGLHDDSELSLAGLQDKMLLVRTDEGWAGAEADCLLLARAAGLTPCRAEVIDLKGIPCFVTERFDRKHSGSGAIDRLHQEDLCQAVGVDGADARGRRNVERVGGGGPGWRDAARLLDAYANDPQGELSRLVRALTFVVAIGNADAHAKNLSFLLDKDGSLRLAPAYDTVPTVLWPRLTVESAMAVNGRFPIHQITLDDVALEARSWGFDPGTARGLAAATLEQVIAASDGVRVSGLSELVQARCQALLRGAAAGG